jgi:hypothetical protein
MSRAWLVALVLAGGCAKKAPPEQGNAGVPMLSAAEVQRSQDACKTYVEQACACAGKVPAMQQTCDLAKALPEAVRISLEVAASPDSTKSDAISAQSSVRKTVKECIEQTAKLPSLGCP